MQVDNWGEYRNRHSLLPTRDCRRAGMRFSRRIDSIRIRKNKSQFASLAEEAMYCCELWDISGNQAHRNSRNVFYSDYHALIFVHDLTNRKSLVNITQWAEEVLGGDQESGANVPLVLVGTKQNEVPVAKRNEITERSRRTAEEIGAEHINLDSMDSKVLMPGSSVKIAFSKFFDRAVQRACSTRNHSNYSGWNAPYSTASTVHRIHKKAD